jgi:hypothetical protein
MMYNCNRINSVTYRLLRQAHQALAADQRTFKPVPGSGHGAGQPGGASACVGR